MQVKALSKRRFDTQHLTDMQRSSDGSDRGKLGHLIKFKGGSDEMGGGVEG